MTRKVNINPNNINSTLVDECIKLYPTVLDRVYKEARPGKDTIETIGDDTWRYETLPASLKSGDELSKAQLARLVKWKITHGKYRPFLPGMIQTNTESEVQDASRKAVKILQKLSTKNNEAEIIKGVEAALSEICVLKGVGPATGTLVLSVYSPKLVPFFEDELFHWLVPGYPGKLKYDKKEYKMILERVLGIVFGHAVDAWRVEKTAYVVQHLDVLEEDEVQRLTGVVQTTGKGDTGASKETASQPEAEEKKQAASVVKGKAAKGKRLQPAEPANESNAAEGTGTRRSKRTKK